MKNEEAAARSLKVWLTSTRELTFAYGTMLSGDHRPDAFITLNTVERLNDQIKNIFNDLSDFALSLFEDQMRKIGEIRKKVKENEFLQIQNTNQSLLMLMPASVQIGEIVQLKENKFDIWLNNLKIVLCAEGVVKAIESPLNKNDPFNLIARGRILLSTPHELQKFIKKQKIAYYMIQILQKKNDKIPFSKKQLKTFKKILKNRFLLNLIILFFVYIFIHIFIY